MTCPPLRMNPGLTVLLVEDDAVFLRIAAIALRAMGCSVVAASSPDEAISRFDEQPGVFDVLITDAIMPSMHGRELSELLTGRKSELKTLYMSGYDPDVLAERGLVCENDAFLQKPFILADLAGCLRTLLDVHARG